MSGYSDQAYLETFPFDGYDPVHHTVYGKPVQSPIDGRDDPAFVIHKNSSYVEFASFVNLPSSMRKDERPGFWSSVKDFFFWPQDEDASDLRKAVGVVAGTILSPFKLLSIMTGTLIHILMFVTECAPLALQYKYKEDNGGNDSALSDLFGVWHFIGRAITSPIVGMRMEFKKPGLTGWFKAGLSAATTIVAYGILAPILATVALNYATANAPALVSQVAAFVMPWISPFLPTVVPYIMPVVNTLVYLGMSASNAFFTIATSLIGIATAFITLSYLNVANKAANLILNAAYTNKPICCGDSPDYAPTTGGLINTFAAVDGRAPGYPIKTTTPLYVQQPGGYGMLPQRPDFVPAPTASYGADFGSETSRPVF